MSRPARVARDILYNFRSRNKVLQRYDNFLILSFQSTYDQENSTSQEIIEFPCLKVNSSKLQIIDQFHQYVQPKVNKELTPSCTEHTGITQEMVNGAPQFSEVLDMFKKWLEQNKSLNSGEDNIFVTHDDWDLRTMLSKQCEISQVPIPSYFSSWVNMAKCFEEVSGKIPKGGIPQILTMLNLPKTGKLYSGIDGCHNILTIMKRLAEIGYVFGYDSVSNRDERYVRRTYCPPLIKQPEKLKKTVEVM